jgi:hypothetical protein
MIKYQLPSRFLGFRFLGRMLKGMECHIILVGSRIHNHSVFKDVIFCARAMASEHAS